MGHLLHYRLQLVLALLLAPMQLCWAATGSSSDNQLPSDAELLSTWGKPEGQLASKGQPEEISPLAGLASDEESFNRLMVLAGSHMHPGYYHSGAASQGQVVGPAPGGTFHFVSSTFPEVDARGFHESVFDSIGDYFPSWPRAAKRMDSSYHHRITPISKVVVKNPTAFASLRKRASDEMTYWPEAALSRKKREVAPPSNKTLEPAENSHHQTDQHRSFGAKHVSYVKHLTNSADTKDAANSRTKRSGALESRLRRARGSMGFHADTFSDGFGDFQTMKRSHYSRQNVLNKILAPLITEYDERLTKRRPEMDSMGFHGDTFGGGFGDFETMKKRRPEMDSMGFHGDTFGGGFGDFETMKKRRPEMDSSGFHGDMFGGSFGDFETMKKRRPEMDSSGFHGDMFGGSFGDFETMKKRRPEMDSMGFHGDTFGGGFGDFETMKKRRPEMDSMGFHGDTFGGGFGDFETMKKRRPEMDSMGFHGDTFGGGFGDFETMKKRRPEMDSMGFHGDTFGGGFGDFETMKKRRPEMDSMGFHGDLFTGDMGDFETMKKRSLPVKRKETVDFVSPSSTENHQHPKSILSQLSSHLS
ncbi:uncharacterized protein LOC111057907 [Nilaparvata lugens]|uniref:uncharacterized protein LOC111057907 n=1 Tax=Nilaparvata lugens TaxID=108931 RepID=UPI00193D4E81|nr:uncharacterized protein LOC111057907 [Nilaparvata lugens]